MRNGSSIDRQVLGEKEGSPRSEFTYHSMCNAWVDGWHRLGVPVHITACTAHALRNMLTRMRGPRGYFENEEVQCRRIDKEKIIKQIW